MKNFFVNIVAGAMNRPKSAVALFVIVTIFFLAMVPKIKIDTDPENMLSPDEPVRLAHSEVKRDFALHDAIIVGVVDNSNENSILWNDLALLQCWRPLLYIIKTKPLLLEVLQTREEQ